MTSVRRDLANDGGRAFRNLFGNGRAHLPDRLGNACHGHKELRPCLSFVVVERWGRWGKCFRISNRLKSL
jgi:hypothetical protein